MSSPASCGGRSPTDAMPERRNILQVSTADERGGAEGVARNLLREYRARGHRSQMAVGFKCTDEPDVFVIPNDAERNAWGRFWLSASARLGSNGARGSRRAAHLAYMIGRPAKQVNQWLGIEDFQFAGTRRIVAMADGPDIVHCHNLHGGYFDLRALQWLSSQLPVVITMHDAWLLSGHCVHSFDCERWETGCGSCPDLTLYPAVSRDATAHNWKRKRRIYAASKLNVATPCQWLMDKVKRSILTEGTESARVIPHGVDLKHFRPIPRSEARAHLGLADDVDVLLFAANGVRRNVWKDYVTMRAAVGRVAEQMRGRNIVFIALGDVGPSEAIGAAEVRFVPYQRDPDAVARYYSAADLYIHGTRADTFPNVILEALACGTPVIGTAVGGVPEQIKGYGALGSRVHPLNTHTGNEATGMLVPAGEPEAMAHGISSMLLDTALRRALSANAVEDARQRFDLQRQVTDYLQWYCEIFAERRRSKAEHS
jgi:glycosyltransferase involved in cell wall biosynthesis